MNQLLSYVPPVLWDVLEFQLLTEAAQVAFDRLSKETGSLLGRSFFDDADEVYVNDNVVYAVWELAETTFTLGEDVQCHESIRSDYCECCRNTY